jgi:Ca2+-transporting ATPase
MSERDYRERGLTQSEAERRLREVGLNALPRARSTPLLLRFARQFASPLMYVLVAAVAIDLALWWQHGADGWPVEAIAIAVILLLNAGFGVFQERKAEAALVRLKSMAAASAWVLRDGTLARVPAQELVPDDWVRLEAGDRVPADAVLADGDGVMVDESVLTGESVPVDKAIDDELLSGTLLVRGKGYARLTRTGPASAMGRLATLIGSIEQEPTPLEQRLARFGHQVAWAVLAVAALMVAAGVLLEGFSQIDRVFLFAVALAVAVIPEGLPAVLTLTLALGVERMAHRRAIVRRLSSVEALGSVTVIATDKTGTLTENRMVVRALDSPDEARALRAMVIANDAEIATRAGDPLELALLDFAAARGLDVAALAASERVGTLPFDSAHRLMRVSVREGGGVTSYVKGAPEAVLARSRLAADEVARWSQRAQSHAAEGARVIALGARAGAGEDELDFLGLALLWDPPRPEVPDAIRAAQAAGIRVLMITGDHPATAAAVAGSIGIARGRTLTGAEVERLSDAQLTEAVRAASVFARVTPEHKLRVVEALKRAGEVVAVTGDGVNDAPALKRADVGVAMGLRGSDVSREVADLVLTDDNFATIVAAVEEGRSIYENIQKFIRFFFSTDLALVLLIVLGLGIALTHGFAEAGGLLFLPLTAVQLLWINVVADGPPALALALDRNPGVMRQRPRPMHAPLLDRASLRFIAVSGLAKALAGAALLLLLPWYGADLAATRTAVFLLESLAQIVYAYPARIVSVTPRPNVSLHAVIALGVALQVATVLAAPLRQLLGLSALAPAQWAAVGVAFALTWALAELIGRRGGRRPA